MLCQVYVVCDPVFLNKYPGNLWQPGEPAIIPPPPPPTHPAAGALTASTYSSRLIKSPSPTILASSNVTYIIEVTAV